MSAGVDCLVFVEDPGAANYVAPLLLALASDGCSVVVVAQGLAQASLVERGLGRFIREAIGSSAEILEAVRPRIVISGTAENPDTLGLALIAEARGRGITTVGVVDTGVNADRRFRGRGDSPLAYAPDWVLVPDERARQAFVAIGVTDARTIACGNPHFDYVAAVGAGFAKQDRDAMRHRRIPGAAPAQRVVVFASELSARLDPNRRHAQTIGGCTLRPGVSRSGRTEILLEAFAQAVRGIEPRPYLVLRLHPKDVPADYQAYASEFDVFDAGPRPLELVFCADVVVGATSMLLEEAACLGSRTVSIVPSREEADWLPSVRAGDTPVVTSVAGLETALRVLLASPCGSAARDASRDTRRDSLERAARFVRTLASDSPSVCA